MRGWGIALSLIAAAAAAPAPARAVEVADGRLTLSGFGEWGYGRTGGENAYLIGTEDGEYEHAQFSLALTAQPQEDVVVAGQLFVVADGETSLDWAFAEYRVHDLLRVRAGKVKNPFGLFMEVKDVGTLRPFFALPQSIYGAGNFGAESYLGAGITGEWQSKGGWGIEYDLYGGALELAAFEPGEAAPVAEGLPQLDFRGVVVEEEDVRDVVGGRVTLSTPVDGFTLRLSGYTGELSEEDRAAVARVVAYGVSVEWTLDRLQLRGELFRATEGDEETNVAGYAEVAWSFLPKLQAALRYEQSSHEKDDAVGPASLEDHREAALGLAYWPSPNLTFKASYHLVDGNRFAVPALSRDDGSLDERTGLVVVGAQFSF
jgi:hypothetical protein